MKKLALTVLMASTILATGCETIPSTESVDMSKTTDMVIGSITGAVLGNQVGDGNGKTLATIVAAIGGGYLGGELAGDGDTQVSQKASTPQGKTPEYMNNTRSTVKTSSSSNKLCHKKVLYDKTINMDVDLAYVKFKRAFDYKTRSEKLIEAGLDPNCTDELMCRFDQGFKHSTQPGISYRP